MDKTTFEILKMDCPSEENLLRMKLDIIRKLKILNLIFKSKINCLPCR